MAGFQRLFFVVGVSFSFAFCKVPAWSQQSTASGPNPEAQPQKQTPAASAGAPADPTATAGVASTGTDASQAKAAFEKQFAAYKAAIREIEKLQSEFQTADPATRERLNVQLTGEVAHAQSLVNEMVDAAMAAYRLAPNADPRIGELLNSVARYYVVGRELPQSEGQIDGGDQYERARPIIKTLVEGGSADRELLLWGFLSAFATTDYDLAEHYLQQAQQLPASKAENGPADAAKQGAMALVNKLAPELDHYRELWTQESAIRAAETKADDLPRVKLTTTKGEITLELFENEAPQSVANFLALVKQGYYDGSPFHRVIAKFMAQGGTKNADGSGELGYAIRDESTKPNHRYHFRGSLSMARLPGLRDSGSSQFFLTFVPTPHLNGEHTVFGRVIEGMEVLGDLQRREPNGNPQHDAALPEPDRILKAEILRDRGHEYAFDKLPAP